MLAVSCTTMVNETFTILFKVGRYDEVGVYEVKPIEWDDVVRNLVNGKVGARGRIMTKNTASPESITSFFAMKGYYVESSNLSIRDELDG